jgi:hypothetical protein
MALMAVSLFQTTPDRKRRMTARRRKSESLWLDVAERRAGEIDEGKVQLVTPEELERRIQARLSCRTGYRSSLEEGVEAAWLEEAERRGREIDGGVVQCIPAHAVFARIDRILGKL